MRRAFAIVGLMVLVGALRSQTPDFAGSEKVIAAEMAAANAPGAAGAAVKGDRFRFAGLRALKRTGAK